jgi:hypothetical protein
MQYKGVEYKVVQTASPKGWKWTFQMQGQNVRSGTAMSRTLALISVQSAIDRAIRVKRQRQPKITKQ